MDGVLFRKTPKLSIDSRIIQHELGAKMVYVTSNPTDPANKGYRIWYSVAAHGETSPENPDELCKSFFTKQKKDVIEFDFGYSGKTTYFAVQIENNGKKGSWGPMVSTLIPVPAPFYPLIPAGFQPRQSFPLDIRSALYRFSPWRKTHTDTLPLFPRIFRCGSLPGWIHLHTASASPQHKRGFVHP
jgi:hypothetical protein